MTSYIETILKDFEASPFGPPETSGVYLVCISHIPSYSDRKLLGRERVLYVGSSKNIKSRVMQGNHPYRVAYDRIRNFSVYVKYYECENYILIENMAIRHFKPILNKRGVKNRNGEKIH